MMIDTKTETDKTGTAITSEEAAFYLRDNNIPVEQRIARWIYHLQCPAAGCNFDLWRFNKIRCV